VDGQGVVTQRTPVSFVAQTGLYSRVHIGDLGSLHTVTDAELVCLTGASVVCTVHAVKKINVR